MASDRTLAASRLLNRPLYLQVRDAMIERIGKGEWKPGTAIPNELELAREFGLSCGTMRKALDVLEADRVLTRRQGRGTFLNDQSSGALVSRFCRVRAADGKPIDGDAKTIEIVEAPANEQERGRLRLGKHDHVYRLRGVCLNEGLPYMVEEAALPAALFPGLSENKGVGHHIGTLAQQFGILLGKAEERILIGTMPAAVADTLRVPPNTPVMLLDRLLLTLDGRPVEWRVAHCHLGGGFYLAEMG